MVDRAIHVGDMVRDFHLGLIWKVVDQDDDGVTYIERNNVRSFVTLWHLELVSRQRAENALSGGPASQTVSDTANHGSECRPSD